MRWAVVAAVLVFGLPDAARADAAGEAPAAPLVCAQSSLAVIDAPKRLKTDQETVDFSGRAIAPGEVTLTVNGKPVTVAPDGSFRIRQEVPVGRTDLLLVLEGSYGDRAEHKVLVRRSAAVAAEGSATYGRFHALVIGNNNYTHLTDLEMAVIDAEAVGGMLDRRYGFDVEMLIDASRYDIISALSRLCAELNEGDNLLVYYAGHGSLDIGSDEGYWLPVDAEPDNPVNWITNSTITAQLRAMRAKHVLVVADSVYSGKLTRSNEARLMSAAERTAWLKRTAARRSRTVLTSGGLEPVLDAGGGKHSVFARAFIEALDSNTRVLDGQALFDAIKRPVVVNADQTPEYADIRKAGHDGGDFLFVPLRAEAAIATAAPPVIVAPKRIDTDRDTIDFTGIVKAAGQVTLTVDGVPVAVAADGSFRIRRQVPVGRTPLQLIAEDLSGQKVEQRVFVQRTEAESDHGFGNYHALIIGINAFSHLPDLQSPVADADTVAQVLIDRYGFSVEMLTNATRSDIISALARKRAELTDDDNLLIYYAGHGVLDVGADKGYWLPVDAEPDNPVNWISNSDITSQLRAMRAKHVMVIADSCFSALLSG